MLRTYLYNYILHQHDLEFLINMIQIIKKHVDNYYPPKIIPRCQLSADFMPGTGQRDIPMLQYQVNLIGAKKPHNKFVIKPPVTGEGSIDHSV